MSNANKTANYPIEILKGTAESFTVTIENQDLSGKTVNLRVKQFAGDTSHAIDKAGVVSYSSPDTSVAFSLTTSDTNLSFSRGVHTIANVTDDEPLLTGEFFVKDFGY